jgi:Mycothiol maleylpyruvate isomerase N-terminal domain
MERRRAFSRIGEDPGRRKQQYLALWGRPEEERVVESNAEYVDQNREQLQRLRRLVARLSDDDLMRELAHGWTVSDTLSHLAFYDRRAQVLLERFPREGVFPSPYDYDTLNAALPYLTRRIPPREVATEAVAAAEAADQAAAAIPHALVGEIRRLNQVKLERAEHRRSHLDDIEAVLAGD